MKKILTKFTGLMITVSMLCTGVAVMANEAPAFTDVLPEAWYYSYVRNTVENGILDGINETEFKPEDDLTRGMFVNALYRLSGEELTPDKNLFSDVKADSVYASAVWWAYKNKITTGVTENEFMPDASIKREEAAAFISRYLGGKGYALITASKKEYKDTADISEYAQRATTECSNAAILQGDNEGNFLPQKNITRAEGAAVLVRIKDYIEQNKKDCTLNTADAEKISVALKVLKPAIKENSELVKDIYKVAFSKPLNFAGTASEVLDKVFSFGVNKKGDTEVSSEIEELLKMVVPTLYGGSETENETGRYFGGEKKSKLSESDFISGDVLVLEENENLAKMYMYDNGFTLMSYDMKKEDTADVIDSLAKSKRFVVLRPSYAIKKFNHFEEGKEALTKEQEAIVKTAENYLIRGYRIQYDDTRFLSGGDYRWQIGVKDVEDYTSKDVGYTNCAAFAIDVYTNALGLETTMYWTQNLIDAKDMQHFYYEVTGSETDEEKTQVEKEFFEALQPGDIIVYRRASSGHAILYVGNGTIIHSRGDNYNYTAKKETYEPTISYWHVKDLFTDSNAKDYVFGDIKKIAIVRPLGEVTESAKNRMEKLQGIVVEKLCSHNTATTVNYGDEITFTFAAYNTNDYDAEIDISDNVPENTTYVSGAENVSGDNLSWKLKVPAGGNAEVSYKVKVNDSENVSETGYVLSDAGKVCGVSVKCPAVYIKKTLSKEEQEKLVSAANKVSGEPSSEIAKVNTIYSEVLDIQNVFSETTTEELMDRLFEKNEKEKTVLKKDGPYSRMVVPTLYGGRNLFTARYEYKTAQPDYRTELVREENLVAGDILVVDETDVQKLYVYTGDGLLDMTNGEKKTQIGGYLDSLIAHNRFVVLRPSMAK